MEYHRTRATMLQAKALLITAIFCFSSLPHASYSLPAVPSRGESAHPHFLTINNVNSRLAAGTSSVVTQPSRRALSHASHGVKVEMQRIEMPCGLAQKTGDGGHSDHQRLRCAVQRSSLRAQEVRKGPRMHSGAGSKAGETPSTPSGSSTAGKSSSPYPTSAPTFNSFSVYHEYLKCRSERKG